MGMLTPRLEKLIVEGKASFKTFTAGGSASQVLHVADQNHIIIIGLIHFPFMPVEIEGDINSINLLGVTQMKVFSQGANNNFVFRNDWGVDISINLIGGLQNVYRAGAPTYIDTYLLHTEDVAFNFSKGGALTTVTTGIKPTEVPAIQPRSGYGKIGINSPIGNVTVELTKTPIFFAEFRPLGRAIAPAPFTDSYIELMYPVINGSTNLVPVELDQTNGFPIVQVQYVEIKGIPDFQSGT